MFSTSSRRTGLVSRRGVAMANGNVKDAASVRASAFLPLPVGADQEDVALVDFGVVAGRGGKRRGFAFGRSMVWSGACSDCGRGRTTLLGVWLPKTY